MEGHTTRYRRAQPSRDEETDDAVHPPRKGAVMKEWLRRVRSPALVRRGGVRARPDAGTDTA